jgi:hypothetical protein
MDCYDIWVDLRNSHKDLEFAAAVRAYMGHLQQQGLIEGYRLTRRKLGFGPPELGEFHIRIETQDLAQLERAFSQVVPRAGETEQLHAQVYGAVTSFRSALYRDFPDPGRAPRR